MGIGILESQNQKDLGIAGVIAAILVVKGATWAFGAGIILTFLIFGKKMFFQNETKDF
ncbi:hypothetical protein KUV50_03505 [Membranicola marinus]|uniref:Uncharacterized protein n=1 Tax=Membranihabitans marinus TaxID=1227546 RepID=A0A953HK56_9BACT|nr:hypothetical protein [Membranihabitans marinus]MBY5957187.1 hypothetical protein [Membranihabitans marinus]